MPLVRVSLLSGKSTFFKQKVSDAIHQSLVTIFNVPVDDRFQIIEEIQKNNIIFPGSYLDIPHTDQIIYIQITAKRGRTRSMKKSLFKTIATTIERETGHDINDVIITLLENEVENWSFGRGVAQLIQ